MICVVTTENCENVTDFPQQIDPPTICVVQQIAFWILFQKAFEFSKKNKPLILSTLYKHYNLLKIG
jgi:hypothetical protein